MTKIALPGQFWSDVGFDMEFKRHFPNSPLSGTTKNSPKREFSGRIASRTSGGHSEGRPGSRKLQ